MIHTTCCLATKNLFLPWHSNGMFRKRRPQKKTEDLRPPDRKRNPLIENEDPLIENEDPLIENEDPLIENEDPLVENEDPLMAFKLPRELLATCTNLHNNITTTILSFSAFFSTSIQSIALNSLYLHFVLDLIQFSRLYVPETLVSFLIVLCRCSLMLILFVNLPSIIFETSPV